MTRTLVQMIEAPVDASLDREELCRLYRDSDETVAVTSR